MTNFWEALDQVDLTQQQENYEYRLYYDNETGVPLFYSMSHEPGTYIVVDKETYNIGNYHCVVKDNKIVNLNIVGSYRKLVPGNSGVTTHADNVMIITEKGQNWVIKTYGN